MLNGKNVRKTWMCVLLAGLLVICAACFLAFERETTRAENAVVTTDEAVVYDYLELTGKTESDYASDNRHIAVMPASENVAIRMKIKPGANDHFYWSFVFLPKTTGGYEPDGGYYLTADWNINLTYYNGTESITADTIYIDDMPASYRNMQEFVLEFGSVKSYTDGVWTGNYVYVKIDDVLVLECTDNSAEFQNKGTYVGLGKLNENFISQSSWGSEYDVDEAVVYDLFDITGKLETTFNASSRVLGNFPVNSNAAFQAYIDATWNRPDHFVLGMIFFGQDTGGWPANTNGYSLRKDWSFSLRRARGEDVTVTVDAPSATSTDGNVFLLEFGSVKCHLDGEWAGNFVYAKCDGEIFISMVDKAAGYDSLGTYIVLDEDWQGTNMYDVTTFTSEKKEQIEAQVNAVETLIAAIPETVTLESASAIQAAREAYNDLEVSCQALVQNYETLTAAEAAYSALYNAGTITGASLILAQDLSIRFYLSVPNTENVSAARVEFAAEGFETVSASLSETETAAEYTVRFDGITPQRIGDEIAVSLYFGEELKDTCTYGVAQYCENMLAEEGTDESLKALLNSVLVYGAAAQAYTGYNAEEPVAEIPEDLPVPDAPDASLSETANENVYFYSAGMRFDSVNSFYVKFFAQEIASVTLTVNGKEYTSADFEEAGENLYIFYTEGIFAKDLASAVTFELKSDETLVQTLVYSAKTYAYAMAQSENESMRDLAVAAWNYGTAAAQYVQSQEV